MSSSKCLEPEVETRQVSISVTNTMNTRLYCSGKNRPPVLVYLFNVVSIATVETQREGRPCRIILILSPPDSPESV